MNKVIKYTVDGYLSEHFRESEFANLEGGGYTCKIDDRLIDGLEVCRRFLDVPIDITSGFRTEEFNKSVGGSSNSYHLTGRAADWKLRNGFDIWTKKHLVRLFYMAGFTNVKFYYRQGKLHRVHTDVGPTWDGSDFNVMSDKYE